MLALRPNCENCDRPLPPHAEEARICSFECTFCAPCVEEVLGDVCPNCGGGFTPRPIRPKANRNGDDYLGKYPPSPRAKHRPVDPGAQAALVARVGGLPPARR
jgi:hypothetical protein